MIESFEKLFAEPKEGGMRNAIIFQYDRLLDSLKRPRDAGRHTVPASQVLIGVALFNLAGPIDTFDDRPGSGAAVGLAAPIGARAVRDYKEMGRTGPSNRLEDDRRLVRAIED